MKKVQRKKSRIRRSEKDKSWQQISLNVEESFQQIQFKDKLLCVGDKKSDFMPVLQQKKKKDLSQL